MGEVYRARDGKLGRDVAIKVLPDEFARDTERLKRFQREAKVLASLNHPNIAAIYGLEHSDDTHYLVLELVPGETLAERIARGPIPVDEALAIAAKIAEALEEAHEHGIVHRDLKPANIKLTPDDKVKVLDFGLAKALSEEAPVADSSMSPTLTRDATRAGVILGTAAYMSPEQAKGKQVDKRADIWAFGAVLYEMLTGKRAFYGDDVSETLAAVLRAEPDWDVLGESVPMSVRELLRRCLVKNPRERLRDIGDASLFTDASAGVGSHAAPLSHTRLPWLVALAAVAVAAVVSSVALRRDELPPTGVTHLSVPLPSENPLLFGSTSNVAISRDGARIAFAVQAGETSQLFVRDLGIERAEPIAGTEGAVSPLFSADGGSVVYFARGPDRLMRVATHRGPPVVLSEGGSFLGLSWDADESLVLGRYPNIGIWRFLPSKDELVRLTAREGDFWQYWPYVLPERNAILFTANKGAEGRDIDVLDLASGERRVVIRNATSSRYVPTGHLVFAREGTLFAAPFDVEALEVSGEVVLVIEHVAVHQFGGAHYDFSDNDTLVYAPSASLGDEDNPVLLVNRDGNERLLLEGGSYLRPSLSPDGRYVAVGRRNPLDIWLFDSQRDVSTRFTFHDSSDQSPFWSPDGTRLVFASNRAGPYNLFWKALETDEPASAVAPSEYWEFPSDWSQDGSYILFMEEHPSTGDDIWIYSIEEGRARPFLATEFNENSATFSPDGRWIAYASNESGQSEIFVRSVDTSGARPVLVSTAGGVEPRWSPAGGEIFYRNENRMMFATISTSAAVTVGAPEVLFEGNYSFRYGVDQAAFYDVTPDGKQFLMVRTADVAPVHEIRVVLNWFEELERLVPTDH